MSTLGVKTFMSCSYVHEIRNHVHIMGLQNRCKKQLFLWKIGGLRTLASLWNLPIDFRFTQCPRRWYHGSVSLVAMAILTFLQNMLLKDTIYMYVCIIFRQDFNDKQKFFQLSISEKTLAKTVHYIPKALCKETPFHGPFARLSCM